MLDDYYLNQMNEDELKNYASHQNEIEICYIDIISVKNEIIDILQKLYITQKCMYDKINQLTTCRENFEDFEYEISEKYI